MLTIDLSAYASAYANKEHKLLNLLAFYNLLIVVFGWIAIKVAH